MSYPWRKQLFLFLSLLGSTVLREGRAEATGPVYFRSNEGLADPAQSPLPARLDNTGALRWRIPLDPGHSTPILSSGKIFLTAYHAETHELTVMALDEKTGRILWRNGTSVERVEQTHPIGSPATATPACDGRRVYVFFGSLGLLCFDLDGKKLWEYKAGPFQDEYGAGSSPVLVEGKVILNQDHDVDSFLLAVDGATGRQVWKTPRPDAVRSYATPAVWNHNGHTELLVAGALELAGYDPSSGQKSWWVNGLARIVIPTPLPAGNRVYMASWAPGGDSTRRISLDSWQVALSKWDTNHDGKLSRAEITDREVLDRFFRMDLNQDGVLDQHEWERHADIFRRAQNAMLAVRPDGAGEQSESVIRWKHMRGAPYVSTPVLDHGILYMVKEGGIVTKLQAEDGHLLQEERIPGFGNYFSSPVAGDGKVYFASEAGTVSVMASQPEWRVLSSRDFHEKIYATPAFGKGALYVRTEEALYCFEGGKD